MTHHRPRSRMADAVPVAVNGAPLTLIWNGGELDLCGFAQGFGFRVGSRPSMARILATRP
ncbi:hypothetical protein [Pseudotabrizicola sp. 4114]|uniref:hypothetical protein n=1 Tax=Pseudotabrizicola sp. 4114 TaxID=2817731 RepID=UPI00285E5805|nr:thiamine biosynthesis lipoprotein ApbE [Pseudorhodobacter sp. 4114]